MLKKTLYAITLCLSLSVSKSALCSNFENNLQQYDDVASGRNITLEEMKNANNSFLKYTSDNRISNNPDIKNAFIIGYSQGIFDGYVKESSYLNTAVYNESKVGSLKTQRHLSSIVNSIMNSDHKYTRTNDKDIPSPERQGADDKIDYSELKQKNVKNSYINMKKKAHTPDLKNALSAGYKAGLLNGGREAFEDISRTYYRGYLTEDESNNAQSVTVGNCNDMNNCNAVLDTIFMKEIENSEIKNPSQDMLQPVATMNDEENAKIEKNMFNEMSPEDANICKQGFNDLLSQSREIHNTYGFPSLDNPDQWWASHPKAAKVLGDFYRYEVKHMKVLRCYNRDMPYPLRGEYMGAEEFVEKYGE